MKINSINGFQTQFIQDKKHPVHNSNSSLNFMGTPRVDKSMVRFYEFNLNRLPSTVKNFLEGLSDKFKITPLEAQKTAFIALNQAKNINDVQNLFPNEELFEELKELRETRAAVGLLAIYREFKDIFEESILKNGEDLSVYLLKKIFIDSKTLDEINMDIDKDLNEDIKHEFKRRYPDSDYILSSTLKSLGIIRPDIGYQNSLKFTREGYSDEFGIKISQGQLKYWNSLTDEQKFEILSKRCEGRDNWWNGLSYDERLEYAAGVDSEDDLYKNYKRFIRAGKKQIQKGTYEQNLDKPSKKIKIGSANLKDKDIFNLWFRKNIEKFYSLLSEADKDTVHIKRARKLAVRWQEMTPEEKTELINKMREGREPLRYAMIDTWNHSRVLIRELSDFLSAQQILKPVDLLYDTQEFSEFQSKVMTEFWANHRDLAEEFGRKLKHSIIKVELSIQRGQFEDFKQEILRDRAYRIKLLNREKAIEEQKIKEAAAKELEEKQAEIPSPDVINYREEFKKAYRENYNKDKILPASYIDEIVNNMLDAFPQNVIEQITEVCKTNSAIPENLSVEMNVTGNKEILTKMARLQHALEAAISHELCSKWANPAIFALNSEAVTGIYRNHMKKNHSKKFLPDIQRVQRLYNEYKKDLTEQEVYNILNRYFIIRSIGDNTPENNEKLANYIKSYGRSALILFSDKSAFSDDIKINFNKKFLILMPEEIKNFCIPVFNTEEDIIQERVIQQIRGQIARRFDFMPEDFLNTYTQEAAVIIRLYQKSDVTNKQSYSIKSFQEKMCVRRTGANMEGTCLRIPKNVASRTSKIKMLAGEQALADELFRVTNNEEIYSLALEDLCNIFELLLRMKGNKNLEIADDSNNISLLAKIKPNKNRIYPKYKEYLEELNNRAEDIFDGSHIKDEEELLYTLNPITGNSIRDEIIRKKIKVYID